ncbi:EamA family transporter, partial [Klebsiella pneumoniae]
IGACLTATACYGLAGFLTRRWIQQRGGLEAERVALGSQVGATLFLFPFFLWSCWHGPAVDWRQSLPWIAIVMLGVVCTAAGYILYFRLIADIGPLRSLSVTFLIPPFAALWGYLCLGETVEEGLILGALLVCVALWMIIVPSGRKRGVPDGA